MTERSESMRQHLTLRVSADLVRHLAEDAVAYNASLIAAGTDTPVIRRRLQEARRALKRAGGTAEDEREP